MSRIGLIAGAGDFPIIVAETLRQAGDEVVGLGLRTMASPKLKKWSHRYYPVEWTRIGGMLDILRRENVREVVLAGKVKKSLVIDKGKFDDVTRKVFAQAKDFQDMSLLQSLVRCFQDHQIYLAPPDRYIAPSLASPGLMTERPPEAEEWADLRYGGAVARRLAEWEIGQAVVVLRRCVVAAEGLEGTDRLIQRAGRLASPAVVVKMGRPNQPLALDPPAVGLATLQSMKKAGYRCLGVEAGATILIQKERLVRQAMRWNMTIVGLASGDLDVA